MSFLSAVRPTHLVVALLVAGALLIGGALEPSGTARASTSTCDPGFVHPTGEFLDETIETTDGLTREYNLRVPSGYNPGQATPLVFNLHGFTSTTIAQDLISELPATAEAEGFILVTPQGTVNQNNLPFWNSAGAPSPIPDDVAFISELLSSLQRELCIDPARVFATGLSNGGFMSSLLGCALSDRIAAIAPVAGTTFPSTCAVRPMPVIAFHGTEDMLVSLGPVENTAIPAWAAHNNCDPATIQNPVAPTSGVRLTRYANCDGGATVELYVVFDADLVTVGDQGAGHTWPGSAFLMTPFFIDLIGLTSPEISANDLMWDFFLAHPLPNAPKPFQAPTPPPPPVGVGGVAFEPDLAALGLEAPASSSSSSTGAWAIAAGALASVIALTGAGWYARRRPARE